MIISRKEIRLTDEQNRFVESGWGAEVVNDTIVEKIVYDSDGIEVEGYLSYPKMNDDKIPLIVWNRGGGGKDGRIDEFLARGMFGEIASWGYVVLASQYREADEYGGKDVDDILNLMNLSKEIEYCDESKIGMEGWSRGGMMTYKILSLTDKISCAVIISGLADLRRNSNERPNLREEYRKFFGDPGEEFENRIDERSAVNFVQRINKDTKILFIHGTSDDKVSHQDSVDMYEKLKSEGIVCKLVLIENGDHYLRRNRKETLRLRKEWFERYLKS